MTQNMLMKLRLIFLCIVWEYVACVCVYVCWLTSTHWLPFPCSHFWRVLVCLGLCTLQHLRQRRL